MLNEEVVFFCGVGVGSEWWGLVLSCSICLFFSYLFSRLYSVPFPCQWWNWSRQFASTQILFKSICQLNMLLDVTSVWRPWLLFMWICDLCGFVTSVNFNGSYIMYRFGINNHPTHDVKDYFCVLILCLQTTQQNCLFIRLSFLFYVVHWQLWIQCTSSQRCILKIMIKMVLIFFFPAFFFLLLFKKSFLLFLVSMRLIDLQSWL